MTSFCTRYLPQRTVQTDSVLLKKGDQNRELQSVQVANCLEMMNQLSWIVTWSSEIFNNVLKSSQETANRITKVKRRVEKLKERVPNVESLFMNQSPGFFYDQENPHVKRWRRKDKMASMETQQPFQREYAPRDVNRLRNAAYPLPDLGMMDKYMDEDDKKKYNSCIKKYSMPEFFVNEWVKKEMKRAAKLKAERKQRKRKKKRYGKTKRVIAGVERKQYSSTGERRIVKDKETVLEGDKVEFDVEEEYVGRRTTVTDGGLQAPDKKSEIRRFSNQPNDSVKSSGSVERKTDVIPEDSAVGPPPAPVNAGGSGPSFPPPVPVANQSGGPPQPPSFIPTPESAVHGTVEGEMPEDMKQFKKMFGIMRNPWAVINRMKIKKYTEEDFKKWIDPTWEIKESAPVKRKSIKKKPPKTPVNKPKPTGGASPMSNVLAGIRAGGNLKKVGERQLKLLPKPAPDKKTQLMNAIQQGTKLRKVNRSRKKEDTKEVEDAMANNPVMALLRLREKMAMTDSEDDSTSESSSEWED